MEELRRKLNYEINCLVEGLESKEQVLSNIKGFVEEEYISKGSLKKVLGQLSNTSRNDDLTVEEAMEMYTSNGISVICSNGRVQYTDIDAIDIPIEDTQINYLYQRRAN